MSEPSIPRTGKQLAGDLMRQWRENAGIDRYKLAALLGCQRSWVQRLEKNSVEPSGQLARRIQILTGVSMELWWADDEWRPR